MSYGLSLQHKKAIQLFEEAVRLKPEEPNGYWLLAVGYGLLGRLPEAETTLKKLLSLDPGHLEGHHHLGRVLYRQGRLEEAQTQFRQVLAGSADHVDALYHQALVRYRQRDYGTSQKLLTRVLEIDSRHISAHYKFGPGPAEAWPERGVQLVPGGLQEAAEGARGKDSEQPSNLRLHPYRSSCLPPSQMRGPSRGGAKLKLHLDFVEAQGCKRLI